MVFTTENPIIAVEMSSRSMSEFDDDDSDFAMWLFVLPFFLLG
jgi:hypothetical protein